MELFRSSNLQAFFDLHIKEMESEVNNIPDLQATLLELSDWSTYLVSKYEITQILTFENDIQQSMAETQETRHNPFRDNRFPNESFLQDTYKITYKVPYTGNVKLFDLRPSQMLMIKIVVDKLTKPTVESSGYISFSICFPQGELINLSEVERKERVQNEFSSTWVSIKRMIGFVNADIRIFNEHLPYECKIRLEERKTKAQSFLEIGKTLNIPLQLKGEAPLVNPIPLIPVQKPSIPRPNEKIVHAEYSISKSDYENICKIINTLGISMENSAKTFYKLEEEEIRDFIVGTLNTHYIQGATGESFRRSGKTDILIEFENRAAFIAECKIWHGEKMLEGALQQLLKYKTWKDNKLALVLFNKENSNFLAIRKTLQSWVNGQAVNDPSKNTHSWRYKMKGIEEGGESDIFLGIYDFYL